MGQLVHGHGGPGGSVLVEVCPIDLIVPAKVIHVDQEGADLHQVFQSGPSEARISRMFSITARSGARISRLVVPMASTSTLESIIGPAAGGTGNEEESPARLIWGNFPRGVAFRRQRWIGWSWLKILPQGKAYWICGTMDREANPEGKHQTTKSQIPNKIPNSNPEI